MTTLENKSDSMKEDTPIIDNLSIWEQNMDKIDSLVEKFNKRAKKLKMDELSYSIVASEMKKMEDSKGIKHNCKFLTIKFQGNVPVIKGFKFIGTIDHSPESGNIIKNISGEEIPAYYRTAPIKCDHCKTNRARKNTYIIQNIETKEYLQIGRNCLADYFRSDDVYAYAKWLDNLFNMKEDLDDIKNHEYFLDRLGMSSSTYHETLDYLAHVVKAVKVMKVFVTKTESQLNRSESTADIVNFALSPLSVISKEKNRELWKDLQIDNSDIEKAKEIKDAVLSELNTKEENNSINEYENNIRVLLQDNYLDKKNSGFLASVYKYYKRLQEIMLKRKIESSIQCCNEYFGNIGDKIELDLTLMKYVGVESQWGLITFYTFVDDKGRTFVWKSSRFIKELEKEGVKVHLKGSIKDHQEYKNKKQTLLTRCKIITK